MTQFFQRYAQYCPRYMYIRRMAAGTDSNMSSRDLKIGCIWPKPHHRTARIVITTHWSKERKARFNKIRNRRTTARLEKFKSPCSTTDIITEVSFTTQRTNRHFCENVYLISNKAAPLLYFSSLCKYMNIWYGKVNSTRLLRDEESATYRWYSVIYMYHYASRKCRP